MSTEKQEKIEHIAPSRLFPYKRNARTHTEAQVRKIAASIQEFGFTNPCLITDDNQIIAGHGRVRAAELLEMKTVPCRRLSHLSEEQVRAYVLADNRLALDAGWDEELLALELGDLSDQGFDLSLTGFSDDELDDLRLFDADDEQMEQADHLPDDVPEVTAVGDVWQLGDHFVTCGDSLEEQTIDRLLDAAGVEEVDHLLTDPPYGIAYKGGSKVRKEINADELRGEALEEFLLVAFRLCFERIRPGGSAYIWHAPTEAAAFQRAFVRAGWKYSQSCVWVKNNSMFGRQDYQWQHEACLYGWREGAAHNWFSDRKQTTVWNFDRPVSSEGHPTMKPVEMLRYQLKNSTTPGEHVLDIFGGSGSTLVAAEVVGRRALIAELQPEYVDVTIRRWEELTGQQAVHVETGQTFEQRSAE